MKIPYFSLPNVEFTNLDSLVTFLDNLRKPVKEEDRIEGDYPYYGSTGYIGTINDFLFDEDLILLSEDGGYFRDKIKPISFLIKGKCWVNNHAHVLRLDKKNKFGITLNYLNFILSTYDVRKYLTGSTRDKLTKDDAKDILIPLVNEKKILEIDQKYVRLTEYKNELSSLYDECLEFETDLIYKYFNKN